MKYLLIDTSTNALIIMLYDNQVKLDEHIRFGKQDHQAHIVPMIEHMLQTHNLKGARFIWHYCRCWTWFLHRFKSRCDDG